MLDILSGIHSDILFGLHADILLDILSNILSGIFSDILAFSMAFLSGMSSCPGTWLGSMSTVPPRWRRRRRRRVSKALHLDYNLETLTWQVRNKNPTKTPLLMVISIQSLYAHIMILCSNYTPGVTIIMLNHSISNPK